MLHYLPLFLIAVLVGCGDPYTARLPSEKPTPGQIEKLSERLSENDADLLRRWGKRQIAGEQFGGEPTANSVAGAIRHQAEFEAHAAELARQARELEEQKKRQEEAEADARRQVQAQIEAVRERRAFVNAEIKRHFVVEALGYEIKPKFDRSGTPVGYTWVFRLRTTNRSASTVIGAMGLVTVRDAFGKEIGVFPVRLEDRIEPRKSVISEPVMQLHVGDPVFRMVRDARTLFPEWFLESVAFADGSRIDEKSIPHVSVTGTGPSSGQKVQTTNPAVAKHYKAIFAIHPDALTIFESAKFNAWVDAQVPEVYNAYRTTLKSGSTQEIINLFTTYKRSKGIQ